MYLHSGDHVLGLFNFELLWGQDVNRCLRYYNKWYISKSPPHPQNQYSIYLWLVCPTTQIVVTISIFSWISPPHLRMTIYSQGSWSHGSWIYNYLCNHCLSPLMLWARITIRARCTTLGDKVYRWLATGRWFLRVLHQ